MIWLARVFIAVSSNNRNKHLKDKGIKQIVPDNDFIYEYIFIVLYQ